MTEKPKRTRKRKDARVQIPLRLDKDLKDLADRFCEARGYRITDILRGAFADMLRAQGVVLPPSGDLFWYLIGGLSPEMCKELTAAITFLLADENLLSPMERLYRKHMEQTLELYERLGEGAYERSK
jgi:hypothetical protein